jgi:hypothetical protein
LGKLQTLRFVILSGKLIAECWTTKYWTQEKEFFQTGGQSAGANRLSAIGSFLLKDCQSGICRRCLQKIIRHEKNPTYHHFAPVARLYDGLLLPLLYFVLRAG